MNLKIERWYRSDCTIGVLTSGDFKCFTLELPWKDNEKNVSCIYPAEAFKGVKRVSPKNGDVIELVNVIDRSYIQIHSGNFTHQIEGCILVGDSIKFLDTDTIPDITNSKVTLKKLMSILPDKFTIEIV